MISNTKHDGTHKTQEKCKPKATLSARIDETHPCTIKNARLTKRLSNHTLKLLAKPCHIHL